MLRIPKQRPESFLLEMPVVRQNLRQSFLPHRLHRYAIDQAVPLVGTCRVKFQPLQKRGPWS